MNIEVQNYLPKMGNSRLRVRIALLLFSLQYLRFEAGICKTKYYSIDNVYRIYLSFHMKVRGNKKLTFRS